MRIVNKKVKLIVLLSFIFPGRGVFMQEKIEAKSFVVEYRGVLSLLFFSFTLSLKYIFDFIWNGRKYW